MKNSINKNMNATNSHFSVLVLAKNKDGKLIEKINKTIKKKLGDKIQKQTANSSILFYVELKNYKLQKDKKQLQIMKGKIPNTDLFVIINSLELNPKNKKVFINRKPIKIGTVTFEYILDKKDSGKEQQRMVVSNIKLYNQKRITNLLTTLYLSDYLGFNNNSYSFLYSRKFQFIIFPVNIQINYKDYDFAFFYYDLKTKYADFLHKKEEYHNLQKEHVKPEEIKDELKETLLVDDKLLNHTVINDIKQNKNFHAITSLTTLPKTTLNKIIKNEKTLLKFVNEKINPVIFNTTFILTLLTEDKFYHFYKLNDKWIYIGNMSNLNLVFNKITKIREEHSKI